jgi:unsaturated chondroitin disaccharide hydrolase
VAPHRRDEFRLTGNSDSRNRGILAADNLAGRLNPAGRLIRAWNHGERHAGWAIIDCMMNLPLLFWASEQQKDPRYRQIAQIHANRVLECFIRGDGSARHIVSFDPETGEYIEPLGGQGYDADSSWARGQAWALYGFTLAYRYVKEPRYLAAAVGIADYVCAGTPENGLIPVDFRQPADCDFEDSSAASTLASGLLELSETVEDGGNYRRTALKILHALDGLRADYDRETDGILNHCSERFYQEGHNQNLIYADFFYIEAFLKLAGKNLSVW